MTDLLTRIRAHVAQIPTHRCDGCGLDFISETMTCPSCGIADRTRWIADSEANRLLREVAALEPVAHMHGDATVRPMKKDSAFSWEKKVEFSIPLYALTGDSHDR